MIDCYSVYSSDRNLPATQASVLGHTAVTGDIAQQPMNLDVHFGQSLPHAQNVAATVSDQLSKPWTPVEREVEPRSVNEIDTENKRSLLRAKATAS